MNTMDLWDWLILAGVAYVATSGLVRLMIHRRDAVVDELTWRAEMEARRQALEKKAEERRKALERLNQRAG